MCVGNGIGLKLTDAGATDAATSNVELDDLFTLAYGSFVVELADDVDVQAILADATDLVSIIELGETTADYSLKAFGETIDMASLQEVWESGIESVFPYRHEDKQVEQISWSERLPLICDEKCAKPRVIIPVFPGTNCEYDTAHAFERVGAVPEVMVINNLTPNAVIESTKALVKAINNSQIIMLPGGFSGGDEPDGSAKFITAFFRAPEVTEAVRDLLKNRDGLMLGICNGFQALVDLCLMAILFQQLLMPQRLPSTKLVATKVVWCVHVLLLACHRGFHAARWAIFTQLLSAMVKVVLWQLRRFLIR